MKLLITILLIFALMVGAAYLLIGPSGENADETRITALAKKLQDILPDTAGMTDEELTAKIASLAADYHVTLNDSQLQQLKDICRKAEKFTEADLESKAGELEEAMRSVVALGTAAGEVVQAAGDFWSALKGSARSFKSLFGTDKP